MDICPLCESSRLIPVIDRQDVPVFQNVLYSSSEKAQQAKKGTLFICACADCGFVFNRSFEPNLVQYNADYENNQSMSSAFSDHVDEMAKRVLEHTRDNSAVLEIGCGQGYFLSRLLAQNTTGCQFIGFDPAWRGKQKAGKNVEIHSKIFDRDTLKHISGTLRCLIGVVASRHVIEHVADPIAFLENVRSAIPFGMPVEIFLETPTVQWILNNAVLQDLFYEHCSYFTADTIAYAMERVDITVVDVDHVFGGQYLWAHGRLDGRATSAARPNPESIVRLANSFRSRVGASVAHWRRAIRHKSALGRIAVWGAGAKGVTFSAIVDPLAELIDCLIDINPEKQNRFTAITSHPVVSAHDAGARGVHTIIIMNSNYRTEIESFCRASDLRFLFLNA